MFTFDQISLQCFSLFVVIRFTLLFLLVFAERDHSQLLVARLSRFARRLTPSSHLADVLARLEARPVAAAAPLVSDSK